MDTHLFVYTEPTGPTNLSIMFSGGLDSLVAWHAAKSMGMSPQAIYVDMGHPYAQKELDSMSKNPSFVPYTIVNMNMLYPLIQHRLKNQIIPSRNLMLATIGAMFNDTVWINALDGEQHGKERDKSEKFFEDSTNILTFLNNFFQPRTIVETPFAKMSKTEVVQYGIELGIPVSDLLATTSCYSGEKTKCGKCLTCFKRWAAFKLNGINEQGYEAHPLTSEYFAELAVEIPKAEKAKDYSRFTEKRIQEFNNLLRKV